MKIPFVRAHVFWTPWWDVDHHAYGCPIEIIVHTPRWVFMARPFSGFAQGGDLRGMTDFHGYEHTSKWRLDDNTPERFSRLGGIPRCRCRFCAWCLHDEETCRLIGGHKQPYRLHRPERYVRRGAFLRHLWLMHVRERHHCGIRIKDAQEVEIE